MCATWLVVTVLDRGQKPVIDVLLNHQGVFLEPQSSRRSWKLWAAYSCPGQGVAPTLGVFCLGEVVAEPQLDEGPGT